MHWGQGACGTALAGGWAGSPVPPAAQRGIGTVLLWQPSYTSRQGQAGNGHPPGSTKNTKFREGHNLLNKWPTPLLPKCQRSEGGGRAGGFWICPATTSLKLRRPLASHDLLLLIWKWHRFSFLKFQRANVQHKENSHPSLKEGGWHQATANSLKCLWLLSQEPEPTCFAPRTTGTIHSGSVAWVLSSIKMERNCILASLGSPAPTHVQQMTSAFWKGQTFLKGSTQKWIPPESYDAQGGFKIAQKYWSHIQKKNAEHTKI